MKRTEPLDGSVVCRLKKISLIMKIVTAFLFVAALNVSVIPDANAALQEGVQITGTVTDSEGLPVIGAAIVVKGTTFGTITNVEGYYELMLPEGDNTILISFVGMKTQEIVVDNQTVIDLVLEEDVYGIDEVVAIGYGTMRRSNLTNAVSKVNSDVIEDRPITDISEAFQGQIAGVYAKQSTGVFGQAFDIEIRGVNSITSSSNPLFVVDGLPVEDMKDINMGDVASIEVLKDASASAIYGARGAGGIVLITTKTGKPGETKIDFDYYTGFQKITQKLEMVDGPGRIESSEWYRKEQLRRDGLHEDPHNDPNFDFLDYPTKYQQLRFWYNSPELITDTDWEDAGLQNAPKSSYSLTLTKGIQNGSFLINATYLDQQGVLIGTGYDRFNFRANSSYKLFDRLEVGLNLSTSSSVADGMGTEGKEEPYMRLITMEPTVAADANYRSHPDGLIAPDPNPIMQSKYMTDDTKLNRTMGNAFVNLEILPGLMLRGQVGLDLRNESYTWFKPMDLNKKARREGRNWTRNSWKSLYQGTLDYNRSFGNHTIGAMAGLSYERYFRKYVDMQSWDFATDDIYTFNTAATLRSWNDTETEWALASFFGRIQYNYGDRYLVSGSLRRDGSSRFGKDNKWGIFPAVSAAWRISEESFMEGLAWMSNFKIRASWGQTGNDNIGNYSSFGTLSNRNYAYGGQLNFGFAPSSPDNPTISWETTTTTNLGVDFGFLANRITLAVDVYQNDTENLLLQVPAPAITGFKGSLTLNSGAIQNRGIEIELASTNIRSSALGGFTWRTMFNLARNENEVKSLGYGIQSIIGELRSQPTHITMPGLPIMSYYLYEQDGLYTEADIDDPNVPKYDNAEAGNEKIVDHNGDGIITDLDRTIIGDNLPDAIMGLTNTFKIGNFDLSILLTASVGYDTWWMFGRYIDASPGGTRSNIAAASNHYRSAAEPGDGIRPYPFGQTLEFSDRWMYKGDYFRIKNLTFGYTIPSNLLSKIKIRKLRVYFSADNLLHVGEFPGGNPETEAHSGGDYVRGVDYGTYPLYSTYIVGIKLGF